MEASLRASRARLLTSLAASAAAAMCCMGVPSAHAEGKIEHISVGMRPAAVAEAAGDVWVANKGDETVTELEAGTGAVVRTIKVTAEPVAITADAADAWVVVGEGIVDEIEASTGTVIRTIGATTESVAISSDGTDVWVASEKGERLDEIEAATGTVVRRIALGFRARGVSSDGVDVWVTNWLGHSVAEYEAPSGTLVRSISIPGSDTSPIGISSDGTNVWVADGGEQAVTEIEASTGAVVDTIHGVGFEPETVSSDGTHVWVGEEQGDVDEIEAATGTVVNTVNVGGPASGTAKALWSDGSDVWVANTFDNAVSKMPVGFTPECAADSGTLKLSPGLTNTPAVQTVKLAATTTGCEGENFSSVSYKATIKTAAAVSCSVLSGAGEALTGSAKYVWTPKNANNKTGSLITALTEAPGTSLFGEMRAPNALGKENWLLTLAGTVTETLPGTCATKPVKKGTFTGSPVALHYFE